MAAQRTGKRCTRLQHKPHMAAILDRVLQRPRNTPLTKIVPASTQAITERLVNFVILYDGSLYRFSLLRYKCREGRWVLLVTCDLMDFRISFLVFNGECCCLFFSFSQVQVAWSCAVTLWKEEQHPAQVSRPANKTTTSSWNILLDLHILFSVVLRNAEGCEVQNCHSCVCHDQAEGRRFLVFSRRIRSYEGGCENFKTCRSRWHGFRDTNEASILYK